MALFVLAGCDAQLVEDDRAETSLAFPRAERPVSGGSGDSFPSESMRDSLGEAQKIMDRADIDEGMTVADIGAGEGYYTVRLSERVGLDGRVLAQDIDREVLERLGRRVERERLDNVSIKLGEPDDPQLPSDSFDRIFLVHMYHEVEEPYAFLWRLWPALARDGQVIVVDTNRPFDQNGIHPLLLSCEFEAVGFKLIEFVEKPDIRGYFARFGRENTRTEPADIVPCGLEK